jgi:glycosyltransferase involved in cell wall biosynthesis
MIRTKTAKQTELDSPRRRNLLLVIGSFEIGGAEKQMFTLVRAIQDYGISCHVFSLQRGGPLSSHFSELGVPVHSGGLGKGDIYKRPWKLLSAEISLIRLILKLKPRVVHSYLPLATFMGALAGRLCRVPLVITSRRSLGRYQERYRALRLFDLLANKFSHCVTVNSKSVWNDVLVRDNVDPKKLVLIYNGVDHSNFDVPREVRVELRKKTGFTHSHKVVTVVANLIPYKGHAELLDAAAAVLDQIPSSRFWLVGRDRGIEKYLKQKARELGILNRVIFAGERSDIPNILAASDILVLPSHEEGFSNVILEAMAAGLPLVATRVGGAQEAVLDGVTGWLVQPNRPKELATKIVDLLNNPKRSKKWGERGKERVKKEFGIEKMVEEHLMLYQRVMNYH